jgi:hypothetical protein
MKLRPGVFAVDAKLKAVTFYYRIGVVELATFGKSELFAN